MGIGDYFKAKKPETPGSASADSEKPTSLSPARPSRSPVSPNGSSPDGSIMELQPPASRFNSARNSFSNRSTQSSTFLEDIKHEVMVNYLYQQQCSALWVSDGSGLVEGVLLRKAKQQYMACPPALGDTPFAAACAALNVQVRILFRKSEIS
jgi:hypothetical protein